MRCVSWITTPDAALLNPQKSRLPRSVAKAVEVLAGSGSLSGKLAYAYHKRNWDERILPLLGISSEPIYSTDGLDMLVIGSDEVFNCVQSNPSVGFSSDLFGASSKARRLITYAASCGNTTISKLDEFGVADEVAGWLSRFDALSVRDENTATVVRGLTGNDPVRNLDPVLAYDFLNEIEPPANPIKGRYLIAYAYSDRLTAKECAALRTYADERSLKIVNIGGVQGCCDEFADLNPFEVIAAFKGAECVLTDTFHGTILSVITERPFATIVRKQGYGNAEKLNDLLARLNLESGAFESLIDMPRLLDEAPNWSPIRVSIDKGRDAAKSYLSCQVALCSKELIR